MRVLLLALLFAGAVGCSRESPGPEATKVGDMRTVPASDINELYRLAACRGDLAVDGDLMRPHILRLKWCLETRALERRAVPVP